VKVKATGEVIAVLENMQGKVFDLYDDVLLEGETGLIRWSSVHGGEADDLIHGSKGYHKLFGGNGSDTVSYENATSAVTVDLSKTQTDEQGTFAMAKDGFGTEDKLYSIENIIGSNHADILIGDAGDNVLVSGGGKDRLTGGGGADTFVLNGGNNEIADFSRSEGDKIHLSSAVYGVDSFDDLRLWQNITGETYVSRVSDNQALATVFTKKFAEQIGAEDFLFV
jgi:Ca2+-binding RTX toxin-like protein